MFVHTYMSEQKLPSASCASVCFQECPGGALIGIYLCFAAKSKYLHTLVLVAIKVHTNTDPNFLRTHLHIHFYVFVKLTTLDSSEKGCQPPG